MLHLCSRCIPPSVLLARSPVSLGYNNRLHQLDMLKVDNLPFPILLGHDDPAFITLVQAAHATTATNDEEEPGPSEPFNEPFDNATPGSTDSSFQKAQDEHPMMPRIQEDIAKRDDELLDAQ